MLSRAAAAAAAPPPLTEKEAAEVAEAVGPDATEEEQSAAVKLVRGRCACQIGGSGWFTGDRGWDASVVL